MSLPEKSNSVFQVLAQSGPLLHELASYWKDLHRSSTEELNELAIRALYDPAVASRAQIQLGRCYAIQDMINLAESFRK